jgi:hypothetical protein
MDENNSAQGKGAQQAENSARDDVINQTQEYTPETDPAEKDPDDEFREYARRFGRYLGREWRKTIFTKRVEIGIAFGGLLILILYTIFSALQWAQLRWTNRMTREALDGSNVSLNQTLDKMQKQIDAMNTLAANAGTQAEQTKNLVGSTKDLARWSAQSAMVELALNRPVVIAQNPVIHTNPPDSSQPRRLIGYLVLSLENSGRLTAQNVQYKFYGGTYSYSLMGQPEALQRFVRSKIDSVLNNRLEWTKVGDLPVGSPSDHIIPVNLYAEPDGPIYFWAGRVEYLDQLEEQHWFEFCFQVETDLTVKPRIPPTSPITLQPAATTFRCPIGQSSGTYPKNQLQHK